MPFGQSGFFGGLGEFIGGVGGALQPFIPVAQQLLGGQQQQASFAFPQQQAGVLGDLGQLLAPLVSPGSAVGQVMGAGAPGALFRPTASRIAPVNEFSLIGPDGKCHTWLHATPKGYKINKSNVSGRRRRRCGGPR